jgi:Lon protease-like protein
MKTRQSKLSDLPQMVPLFPLSGALLLPFGQRPLNVFEPRYLEMVDDALAGDRLIGLIQPLDASEESPANQAPLRGVGCLGRLTHFEENAEGRYFIILTGICRFRLAQEVGGDAPYRRARIDAAPFASDFDHGFGEDAVDRAQFLKMMRDYETFADLSLNWEEIEKTGTADLVNFCCIVSPYGPEEKQALLEADTLAHRAQTLIAMAEYEMARGGTGAAPLQ